ncbi:hypothetical protein [Paracoccus marinaquae]|uniref:Uncharacterized protein n=1 Tax=Paracoccus marinaquae TaxID=2841926 RepID=A0ABS6AMP1_9RHOB|nr:hypothetical protein [Paracoccus marinaquae]MBU3031362.1 hypothetical protein [Paracoccus marinaquae]
MDGATAQSWRARGVTTAQTRAAQADAEAGRARAEDVGSARQLFRDGIEVMRKGQPFARTTEIDKLLQDPEIAALPEAREYAATAILIEQKPEIAVLPPAKKRELLAELEKTPMEKGYESDVVTALRGMIEADTRGFSENPIGRAGEIGLKTAQVLPDPSTSDPEVLVQALRGRAIYAQSLRSEGYVDAGKERLFTPDERDLWSKAVATDRSPADRAVLAGTMAAALGPLADAAAREVGADPVFALVGGGLAFGMPQQTAREIFEGQRVIEGQQVKLPPVTDRRQAFFGSFSSLFADGTAEGWKDQSGPRDQIAEAADALYAYRMRDQIAAGEDVGGKIVESAYLQAVHEVMGGTGRYDKGDARGGLQMVNDRLTIMPPAISADDVNDRMFELAARMASLQIADLAWSAIAVSGNRPDLGGQRPDPYSIRRIGLRAVGPDEYVMVWPNRSTGQLMVVMGDDDRPVVISMSALVERGVPQ